MSDLRIFELKCRHKVGKRFIISHCYCRIIAGMFFITKDLQLAQVFDLEGEYIKTLMNRK